MRQNVLTGESSGLVKEHAAMDNCDFCKDYNNKRPA